MITRAKILILALVLAVVLGACSTTRIMYTFADDLIQNEAEFYLAAGEEEDRLLRQRAKKFMAWHRLQMLPRYAAFLRNEADNAEQGPVQKEAAMRAVDRVRVLLEETVQGFTPHAAAVLARYTAPDKVAYLKQRLAEKVTERQEELNAPLAKRSEDRFGRIVDNFERFTGDLSEFQLAIIRRHVKATRGDGEFRLDRRIQNSKRMVALMAANPSAAEIQKFLDDLFLRPDAGAKGGNFRENRVARLKTLIAEILFSLSPNQRKTLVQNLRDFAEDFSSLAS
ncbi:MAG: hypothetical protein HQ503_15685 [Rhodospirillales bacterium]|nr:hypothetical protein [Rhodospirillales bacterium]